MAGISRSAKDLWSLISGSPVLNQKELIQYELEENSDRILNGILYFKKSNHSSLDNLKKSVEEIQFEFINKLSKLMDVDAMLCYELFISYATYEYKGTQKTLEAQLINERHVHSLLLEVWHYYYGERLYYLLILKHIISHCQDNTDPYKVIYEKFFDKINKDNSVVTKIVSQMEASIAAELPTKDSHGQYMSDLLVYHWVTFTLKEQCELLQLLLLYYKDIEPTISDVQKIFAVFQGHGFGSRQSFRLMLSGDNQHLINLIGYLESFVVIQSFELEWLLRCREKGMTEEHYLLKDEKAVRALNDAVLSLGSHQSHSPILLAWLIIAQCSEIPEMLSQCNKLGRVALQLDVFEYIVSGLETPTLSGSGVIPEVFSGVVYSLLSALLSQFDLQYLGSLQSLYSIATSILKYESIANHFWKKGDEGGISDLFIYCVEMFAIDFCPLLNICTSLATAGKDSCLKVIDHMKQLPAFTEYLENINERDLIATQEPNVWELIKDKPAYGDDSIIIPKGTIGVVIKDTDKNGSSIIQWRVSVNGWQICLRELFIKFQEMSFSTAFIDVESIRRITAVCKLINGILETNCEMRFQFTHIINIIFSILQRYINSSSPSLDLIAVCINIAATLSKLGVSDVWQQLAQIHLLPSMTSFPKSLSDLVSGLCMNVGILGQLIASRECIAGQYSACLSFLNLILNVSQIVAEDDGNFLACILYILREIFSYFHKWYYTDPQQRLLIGQKCLNILHNIFSVEKCKIKALGKAQELCIWSLLNFEAGQTLLKIVCTGEEVIQQTILTQNSELGYQIAAMIRLSLSVLNRLLLLRNSLTFISAKKEVSPLEAVLFSTPGHVNQPQVVLTVAHYAFQRYNPCLARLAVQLLKRFAKEFPMSLLACFGSEAEAIRDHFLARLNSPYENIRLKVSILEFLTVCVAQQPGLIEMFINVKETENITMKEDEKKKSCLECVKGILKSKNNESENSYPQELLCAAVEFIHALWAGHQALAMEALKKDPQFWSLTCSTLLSNKFSHDSPATNAYIIRTLGLEVFYTKAIRKGLNENVKSIFHEIHQQNLMIQWSEHIHSCHSSSTHFNDTAQLELSSFEQQDTFSLLTAWRDFLLIIAVYEPLETSSETRKQLLKNILEHFSDEIGNNNNSKTLILLSELFLMLSRHWQSEFTKLLNAVKGISPIFNVLNDLALNADAIHPREQLVIVSIAMFTCTTFSKFNMKIQNIRDWIVPCCQLLKKASILVHQPIDPKQIAGVLKLPVAIICLLNELVQETNEWLPVLKNYSVLPLLVSLLMKSLRLEAGVELSHSIIVLFLSLASNRLAAEALCTTGFMPEITLSLSELNLKKQLSEKRKMMLPKPKLSQVDVYFSYLQFVTILLRTLGNYFLQDCWNFIGVHQEILHASLVEIRTTLLQEGIQDAILTAAFILQLSFHQQIWKLEQPKSLQMLLGDICTCIYSTVAILSKPGLLKYLVAHKKLPESKISPLKSLETETLLKRLISDDDSQTLDDVSDIQQKLLELLAVTMTVLKKYSPEMCETMSGYINDYGQCHLLLHVSFSLPSVDQEGPLGFGTVLACVNMCLKSLVKNEKTPSPRKTTDSSTQPNKHLLMYILEISLTILLSQSSIALSHPELPSRDKQLIRRELAAELSEMNVTVNRYFRRGPLSPAGIPSSTTPSLPKTPSTEFPFMRLISNLVDKLFK